MKKVKKIIVAALITVASVNGLVAQTKAKIIAVVNQASWCSVCKANGQRAMGVFMENNKDGFIQFVTNDISNTETTKLSAVEIEKNGLTKAMKNYKASGVVYFFNAKTKEPITQITVANSNDEISYTIGKVKEAIK